MAEAVLERVRPASEVAQHRGAREEGEDRDEVERRQDEDRQERGKSGGKADHAVGVPPLLIDREARHDLKERQRDRRDQDFPTADDHPGRDREGRHRQQTAGDLLEVGRPRRRLLGRKRLRPGRRERGGAAAADPFLVVLELGAALRAVNFALAGGLVEFVAAARTALGRVRPGRGPGVAVDAEVPLGAVLPAAARTAPHHGAFGHPGIVTRPGAASTSRCNRDARRSG